MSFESQNITQSVHAYWLQIELERKEKKKKRPLCNYFIISCKWKVIDYI